MKKIIISVAKQTLTLFDNEGNIEKKYAISTSSKGVGEQKGSEQTPRGHHIIRAKVGHDQPANSVFVGRRLTGECYTPALGQQYPDRDWILTRILWLSGTEVGKNRLGNVDTMARYVYIHGIPDEADMTVARSKGCINMRNDDMIDLFNRVEYKDSVDIQ